jgi:hypothetical protein
MHLHLRMCMIYLHLDICLGLRTKKNAKNFDITRLACRLDNDFTLRLSSDNQIFHHAFGSDKNFSLSRKI